VRLLLDEDIASKELVNRLRARHEIVPISRGESDAEVWQRAQAAVAVIVTMNARDFIALARTDPEHRGLLVVYRERERERDMTFEQIAAAIDRVADDGRDLAGAIVVLNRHRS
jgi:hypothetical protein